MNTNLLFVLRKFSRLKSPLRSYQTLFAHQIGKAYVNGKWQNAVSSAKFDVINPYNGNVLCAVTRCDVSDAEEAVRAARNAFEEWSENTTALERGQFLQRWNDVLLAKQHELAELITLEEGKPLDESYGEIKYAASFLQWFGEEARRVNGQVIQAPSVGRTHFHTRQPIGVVAVITPWNFPSAMITRKVAAALAVGCTVVVKPAEDTPLSALALAKTAHEAGLPEGVFNVIPTDREHSQAIGKFFCESPLIDAISFTGSTDVGKKLLAQSANTVKRVCLELGGNAPLIVFPTAALPEAVQGTMKAKFRGSGQTCICPNRVFVHDWMHDMYVSDLKMAVERLVVGDGMKPDVTQGPLINEKAIKKAEFLIEDALQKGARIIVGGGRIPNTTFLMPTILTNVAIDMEIAHTEIFAPIIAIQRFETEAEVMSLANDTRTGLAGYIFTSDYAQMVRVSRKLQVGIVGINEGLISCAEAAFGGVKESGMGREGGSQGIDEFTQWKYISIKC